MSDQHTALNRFGLGARPGESGRMSDPRGWLIEQLEGPVPGLARTPPDAAELGELQARYREAVRSRDQARMQTVARGVGRSTAAEVSNVLTTRVRTERPFVERWIGFWSNHLCVSSSAGFRVAAIAGSYEREAIRAHALGRFEEMLLASVRHPAMLFYLDNARSVGPASPAVRRPRRGAGMAEDALRGLNENHARELLELHTVGVDGGYTQPDVEQLARVLTGWSVAGAGARMAGAGGGATFRFAPQLHEPGRKTVMGTTYPEGEEGGIRIVRDLARHSSTARFVGRKLATHFIDDVPPERAVDTLAARWMETEGDLREMARTLVELDESWDARYRKFRTPQDWLVAMLRAADAGEVAPNFGRILQQLRHRMWAPPSPKGYGDLRREWADSDSLMNRAELARSIAERLGGRRGRGSVTDVRPLASVVALAPDDPLPGILADDAIPVSERIALGFAGPAFQWR